jgi:hypothetical protein
VLTPLTRNLNGEVIPGCTTTLEGLEVVNFETEAFPARAGTRAPTLEPSYPASKKTLNPEDEGMPGRAMTLGSSKMMVFPVSPMALNLKEEMPCHAVTLKSPKMVELPLATLAAVLEVVPRITLCLGCSMSLGNSEMIAFPVRDEVPGCAATLNSPEMVGSPLSTLASVLEVASQMALDLKRKEMSTPLEDPVAFQTSTNYSLNPTNPTLVG